MSERKSAKKPSEVLHQLVEALGSQTAAARHLGVGRQYFRDLMSGRRGISGRVAKALGFRKRDSGFQLIHLGFERCHRLAASKTGSVLRQRSKRRAETASHLFVTGWLHA